MNYDMDNTYNRIRGSVDPCTMELTPVFVYDEGQFYGCVDSGQTGDAMNGIYVLFPNQSQEQTLPENCLPIKLIVEAPRAP